MVAVDEFPRELLSNHEFIIAGRVTVFKMMVLPKLLYLFRTIPIDLPTLYLKVLKNIVNRFIWNNRKSQSLMHILTRSKQFGGLGALN